ncbi:hypothetical protein EHO58_19405 [Leptospira selangorensis]|uniref:M90 family metallopeptidase n=1 Tax=Leptospira selangorensis TaxID=2484982 RepID=UPI001082EB57|nr:M90 family metallopeptidase [Leptospira selangorensis]TGJ99802.1 hypothetical protein EHO58_19405 [Leptospira selangorensis]
MKIHKLLGLVRRLLLRPFSHFVNIPKVWATFLDERVEYYKNLEEEERDKVNTLIQHFKISKKFIGANNFEVADSHKYLVACLAVRLIKNIGLHHFDSIHTIIIFPSAFKTEEISYFVDGVTGDQGMVGLSWRAVERGFKIHNDGDCVVTHEFTHVIDLTSGDFDGVPRLSDESFYRVWTKSLIEGYPKIRKELFDSSEFVSDEVELFAYLSEIYFEKPEHLLTEKPYVFILLNDFYREYSEKIATSV